MITKRSSAALFLTVAIVLLLQGATSSSTPQERLKESPLQEGAAQKENEEDEEYRRFLNGRCPYDSSMIADGLWFEMDLTLWTKPKLECTSEDWMDLRDLFDRTVANANLWQSGLRIVNLNQHLCHNAPAPIPMQRRLLDGKENGTLTYIPEEWTYDAATDRELGLRDHEHPFLTAAALIFHFFFGGGGKCRLCRLDEKDRRLQQQIAGESGLRGSANVTMMQNNGQSRRRTSCGGCFHLDFSEYGNGNRITGTPYIRQVEYWDSHGVKIKAYGAGYTPGNKARIYDTTFYATNNDHGDPDLGSPNENCPGGGPGIGKGGKPTLDNGQPNPGANCEPQGNVLIVQESNKPEADDSGYSSMIEFTFRFPVSLESVGLMDVDEGSGDFVTVWSELGKHKHFVNGWGENSIEDVIMNLNKVTKVQVKFPGSGAIRFIRFCHDCGEADDMRDQMIQQYYPPSSVRPYENQNTVQHFNSILPNANRQLETILQTTIDREHQNKPSSCLYRKNPKVQVRLVASTPGPANDCYN